MIIKQKVFSKFVNKNKIIVGLTSWPKRINGINDTLISIAAQTIKPDEFYLILSEKEFPNKEKDLPDYIIEFKNHHNFFKIEWTKDNLKNFKKNLPLIKKYNSDPNVILYIIDDDIYYKEKYIEDTLRCFLEVNESRNAVITWNFPWTSGGWVNNEPGRRIIGSYGIYRASFFTPITWTITEEDIARYNYFSEDFWITYNLHFNGVKFELLPYEHLTNLIEFTDTEKLSPLREIHNKYTPEEKLRNFLDCYNRHKHKN